MGIFSSLSDFASAFGDKLQDPNFQDKLAAAGEILQGDPKAYANYVAKSAHGQAMSNAAEIADRVGYGVPPVGTGSGLNLSPVAVQTAVPQVMAPASLPQLTAQQTYRGLPTFIRR